MLLRSSGGDVRSMKQDARIKKDTIKTKETEVQDAEEARNKKLGEIGNLVDDSVPDGEDEANNVVIQTWGEKRTEPELKNHVKLMQLLGIADMKKGASVAGNRGYYLKGAAVRLNQALINFALEFLEEKGYEALQPPFFMTKDVMSKCAQLGSYDEELYKANNVVIQTWGEKRTEPELKNHVKLMQLLGIADMKKGASVAGNRGYYLKGAAVRLNQALINFALEFLEEKGYEALQPPFFMTKDVMSKCAQLGSYDEELYKVTDEGDAKYFIATAEQPLCAYRMDDLIGPKQLPIRYAGYSSCFRKEAGSHGRDTGGLFRVHQFEKVEQFCITGPNDSWKLFEEMIKNCEEFYQRASICITILILRVDTHTLKLPYQVVAIVSGALNDAAAKKYDLEAWFPASATFRELVSCSNCTDYQSRKLNIKFQQEKSNEQTTQFCHLLNSTLTATERTLCCILENYQTEKGVLIPKALQPYMGGKTFLPFPNTGTKEKKPNIIQRILMMFTSIGGAMWRLIRAMAP
ncbi:serine--tRNA ligase-like protein [Tanacetum coccineum]